MLGCVMESLAQLEALCERLYNSQDSVERAHVENTLKCFSVNTDYISQCQYILDNALTPYALMLASSSLLKQVTEHSLALQLRLDICNLQSQSPICLFERMHILPFLKLKLSILYCRELPYQLFGFQRTQVAAFCDCLFDPTIMSSYKVWLVWWWPISGCRERVNELLESGDMTCVLDVLPNNFYVYANIYFTTRARISLLSWFIRNRLICYYCCGIVTLVMFW